MALKGYTTIELYDAKTGELTDRVEKHNLVTQGVQKYLNCLANILVKNETASYNGLHSESGFKFPKYGDDEFLKLFGGVIVCNKNIDESKIRMDYDVLSSIIGHAGLSEARVYDSMSGGINMFESSYDTKTKTLRLVYDFATDKSNGDIACICLVNEWLGGFGVMNNPTSADAFVRSYFYRLFSSSRGTIAIPLLYSDILGGSYMIYSYTDYKITFKVWDFNVDDYLSSFGMLSSLTTYKDRNADTVVLDFSSLKPNWGNVDFFPYAVDSNSNCCRFINTSGNILKLRVCKLDMNYNDYTIDLSNLISEYRSLGGNINFLTMCDFIERNIDLENNKFFFIDPNLKKMFVGDLTSGSYNIFDLPKNNNSYLITDVGLIYIYKFLGHYILTYETSTDGSRFRLFRLMNSLTYEVSNNFYACCPNINDDNYYHFNIYGINQFRRVNDFYAGNTISSNYSFNGVAYDYLATINNQSDVLTKTPDKTMKIIYTLREE